MGFLKKSAAKWVGSFIFGGPIGFVISYFAEKFLGMLVETGILVIDFGIMSAKVAMERDEYADFAGKAYEKALKKVYSESEKEEIRQEYLAALRKFGTVGNGLRDD